MTEENQRRLYNHYVKVAKNGRDIIFGKGKLTERQMGERNVAMMLKAYPHFANSKKKEKKPKPDKPDEGEKSNGPE